MAASSPSSAPRRYRSLLIAGLVPVIVILPVIGTACGSNDANPSPSSDPVVPGVPGGPGDNDDSTTSSLQDPGATAPPNPDAGGGGAAP